MFDIRRFDIYRKVSVLLDRIFAKNISSPSFVINKNDFLIFHKPRPGTLTMPYCCSRIADIFCFFQFFVAKKTMFAKSTDCALELEMLL